MKIRFGSVCSGIEAASVAWHPLGWEAAWLSEIEKFPCEVLKHHYPNTPNLGDMTLLADKIRLREVEAPDVFCGGTPCQAFSVAGLRQSLDDSRGNLSLTFCEIANAIDDRRLIQQSNPAIIFWENVPGVLNTKDNAFGCFLAGLAGESDALIPPGGRWTDAGFIDGPKRAVAWRTLDAQYFGLAQRRKRVFVVASARNDICPAEILFEFEGVRRDTAPSRKEGQETPAFTASSFGGYSEGVGTLRTAGGDLGGGSETLCLEKVGTLLARDYKGLGSFDHDKMIVSSIGYCNDLAPTLTSSAAGISRVGNDTTADAQYVVQQAFRKGRRAQSVDDYETWVDDGKANTLNTFDLGDVRTTHAIALAENTIGRQPQNGGNGNGFTEDGPMYTLNATGVHGVAHAFKVRGGCEGGGKGYLGQDEKAFTISTVQDQQIAVGVDTYNLTENLSTTQTLRGFGHIDHVGGVINSMAVRRLTPIECERLQGFPDNYTNIKANCPDGPRYKALGNSWAVPVVAWIGKRINDAIA